MPELTIEEWLLFSCGFFFFIWGGGVFIFGRISVRHIESEMAKEGGESPVWDKGIGSRVVTYSLIMLFPKWIKPPIVDVKATLRYMRKKDYYLALFLQVFFVITAVLIIVWNVLYGPELF